MPRYKEVVQSLALLVRYPFIAPHMQHLNPLCIHLHPPSIFQATTMDGGVQGNHMVVCGVTHTTAAPPFGSSGIW